MKAYKKKLFPGLVLILIAVYQMVFPYDLSAQLKFSIPSLTVGPGDRLSIPIDMTGVSPDSGIFSIQFEISYDPTIISADTVIFNSSSPIISDWQKEFNLSEGKISCALAGSDSVLSDVIIANLIIIVSNSTTDGDSSRLQFDNLYVNEGTPLASRQDGMVKVLSIGVEEPHYSSIPESPILKQNFPNPFNPKTTISFDLPRATSTTLIVYNILGKEIIRWDEKNVQTGYYSKVWDGINMHGVPVESGVYLYRLIAGEYSKTRKMILLK